MANIRKGTVEDLPAALALIQELATFERAPQEVEVTVEEMAAWGFGPEQIFEFYVLEKDTVVGMALYYYKYSTWKGKCLFLEDIIVTETERGKGYGKMLFDQVVRVAQEAGVRRLEWQVLNWNEPAIRFYHKYTPGMDAEWINCRLTQAQLQSL